MFEAPSETAWGNPYMDEYPGIIAELGFDHVRIPIRWEPADRSSATGPFTIEPDFLARIKEVVDAALEDDLMVIINMHHHEELFQNPDDQKGRFLAQWQQISEYFKDYDDDLVFEILNEPHGGITPEKWNTFLSDALDAIRIDSPERIVLIGTADFGGLSGLSDLAIPDDENIIVTIHYYNPFQFTHQGADWVGEHANDWLGTEWSDSDLDRQIVAQEFHPLLIFSESNNIPVHIGEFGAYSTADIESREKWTTYLARYFEEQNWSWAYWEFSAGFGIYNPSNETFIETLVDALLTNPMPEPFTYSRTTIYESDFSSGTDGWQIFTQGGASAMLTTNNNGINVSVNQTGTENWHIQVIKSNFALQKDKKYAVSCTLSADEPRDFNWSVGMSSSPWTAYSSGGGTIDESETSLLLVLDMNVTDNTARIAFDLGLSATDLRIHSIKLEELQISDDGEEETVLQVDSSKSIVYPNPTQGIIHIVGTKEFEYLEVYDLKGLPIMKKDIRADLTEINLTHLNSGLYLCTLISQSSKQVIRILKE